MAQVKVYGLRETLSSIRSRLSVCIHECVMDVLHLPEGKRAHRFFPMDRDDFLMPEGRTDSYIIVEIQLIEGRTVKTRKRLVRALFDRLHAVLGFNLQDIEITLIETPACNSGFRGLHGDEARLDYPIEV